MVKVCAAVAQALQVTAHDTPALSPALQRLIEPCSDAFTAPALDPIRSKADLSRRATDGPPSFRIALNDTFATDPERVAIAQWLRLQNHCRRQFAWSLTLPRPQSVIEAAALQQLLALSGMLQSSVRSLTRALYFQQLTYGEFAHMRFEFTRDAVSLSSAIDQAGRDTDATRAGQTLQRLFDVRLAWSTYLSRLGFRRPRTVHVQGAIFT